MPLLPRRLAHERLRARTLLGLPLDLTLLVTSPPSSTATLLSSSSLTLARLREARPSSSPPALLSQTSSTRCVPLSLFHLFPYDPGQAAHAAPALADARRRARTPSSDARPPLSPVRPTVRPPLVTSRKVHGRPCSPSAIVLGPSTAPLPSLASPYTTSSLLVVKMADSAPHIACSMSMFGQIGVWAVQGFDQACETHRSVAPESSERSYALTGASSSLSRPSRSFFELMTNSSTGLAAACELMHEMGGESAGLSRKVLVPLHLFRCAPLSHASSPRSTNSCRQCPQCVPRARRIRLCQRARARRARASRSASTLDRSCALPAYPTRHTPC